MKPMRVTAIMGEPVCYYGDGLHLDSMLAYAMFRESGLEPDSLEPVDFELPLKKWKFRNFWGWHSSREIADWRKDGKLEIRKKVEIQKMQEWSSDKSVNVGSGPMKAYNLELPTRQAFTIHWYCVGDENEVERLLNTHVQHIGKKRSVGMGKVMQWVVDESEKDFSIEKSRQLMRAMPVGFPLGCDWSGTRIVGIRPPYWHPKRKTLCTIP